MKKILAVLLIVGLIATIPGMVLAAKEEKGKPETPPGLSDKTNIKVAFKGVVITTASGSVVTLTARVAGLAGAFTLISVVTRVGDSTLGVAVAETTAAVPAIRQVDTITPTVKHNRIYTLRITPFGGTARDFSYLSDGTATSTEISTALRDLVNADIPLLVTASLTGVAPNQNLVLTADFAGLDGRFTSLNLGPGKLSIATTTDAANAIAEVSTITLSGSPRIGDLITVMVAGDATPTTYTVVAADIGVTDDTSRANIALKIRDAIIADPQANGVVITESVKTINVVLVEPFLKILKKRIDAGETIEVNIEKATFFKAPEGKITRPDLKDEYVQILGVYDQSKNIVNAKIVRILVQPPGHVIGMGKITALGTNPFAFALEMKPRKGGKDLVTEIFIVTGKTVIILKGEKVGFPQIETGMRAVVKGYKYTTTIAGIITTNWYATLVILQKPKP